MSWSGGSIYLATRDKAKHYLFASSLRCSTTPNAAYRSLAVPDPDTLLL